jgi:hypothetical protein
LGLLNLKGWYLDEGKPYHKQEYCELLQSEEILDEVMPHELRLPVLVELNIEDVPHAYDEEEEAYDLWILFNYINTVSSTMLNHSERRMMKRGTLAMI